MTTVQANTSLVSPDLMNAVNPKAAVATDTVQADTDKFMTLLVTQLKNQDPMNPLDNAQITSQLAQLSTVTGVNKLNTTLDSLKASYQASQSLQATSMIGHGVLTAGNGATLSDSKAVLGVNLDSDADSVKVVVQNASGQDIRTIDVGAHAAGSIPLAWDGSTDSADGGTGALAADGHYTFRVVAMRGGQPLTDATPLTFGMVASVSTSATDGIKLTIPSVGTVTMDAIKQIL